MNSCWMKRLLSWRQPVVTSLKTELRITNRLKNLLGKTQYQILADYAAKIIKDRTRDGFGVTANRKKKLKALKRSTKIARARFKGLSSETAPGISNLTRSGQLLDAIEGVGLNGASKVQIKTGRNDGSKNDDIIKGQEKQGRAFLELSGGEKQEIAREAKALMLKEIRKRQK